MNISNFLSIIWLPLISYWTFLASIFYSNGSKDLEGSVPFFIYIIVSFLLVTQLQKELGNKKRDMVVKVSVI